MSTLTIKTNNQARPLLDYNDLTTAERSEFNYDIRGAEFFRYKGNVYDFSDAMKTGVEGWDGIYNESAFSGVLIRLHEYDTDLIYVGRYYS